MIPATDQIKANVKRFSIQLGSSLATAAARSASLSSANKQVSSFISPVTRVMSSVAGMPTAKVVLHSLLVKRRQVGTSQPKRSESFDLCGSNGSGRVLSQDVSRGSHPI